MIRLVVVAALLISAQLSYAVTREVTCSGDISAALQNAVDASIAIGGGTAPPNPVTGLSIVGLEQ